MFFNVIGKNGKIQLIRVRFLVLTNHLSKAFVCLKYELLIVKLNVYDFTSPAFKLIHNYLPNR